MKSEIWVDLEGTIILHWNQMDEFINMEKLELLIDKFKPESMGVYSYAVWSSENYTALRQSKLMQHLSEMMNNTYIHVRTTEEMAMDWYALHRHKYVQPTPTEIWNQPKEFAFLMTVNRMIQNSSDTKLFILFDDTAPHGKNYIIDNDVTVVFVNPDA